MPTLAENGCHHAPGVCRGAEVASPLCHARADTSKVRKPYGEKPADRSVLSTMTLLSF